jgi:dTDP-4-dehydrorhamnose reductase
VEPQDPQLSSGTTGKRIRFGRRLKRTIQDAGGRHVIFRTEWVYGTRGKNFLLTILRLATERDELRIVSDQIGAPTWSREIAKATATVVMNEWRRVHPGELFESTTGIYHMTAAGQASWYDFASAIVEGVRDCSRRAGWLRAVIDDRPLLVKRLLPIATKDYPTAAQRPANSVLSNARLRQTFGVELPDWRIQLLTTLMGEHFD